MLNVSLPSHYIDHSLTTHSFRAENLRARLQSSTQLLNRSYVSRAVDCVYIYYKAYIWL